MADITYDKILVTGVEYISIESLEICQQANCHAKASISMVTDWNKGRKAVNSANEEECISIIAEGAVIFRGLIQRASTNYEKGYTVLNLELVSSSILWDLQKRNKSYQSIGTDYGEIMQQSTCGQGIIVNYAPPKASESMVVQYHETVWEFILRIASYMETAVFVDATSSTPKIKIGVSGEHTAEGRGKTSYETGESGSTGAVMTLGSAKGNGIIKYIKTNIVKGTLESNYICVSMENLIPEYSRPSYIGKVFSGVVQTVNQTEIQVWIPELDETFSQESNTWFPYSTAYSTSVNGAGIYCMPVIGDSVRVFLPSEGLKDIFASSGPVMRGILDDKEERCFYSPSGMQVLFAKDGLTISTKNSKAFIKLFKDGNIAIASSKSIRVISKTNINMKAVNGLVDICGENKIEMVTQRSYIGLGNINEGDEVYIISDKVYIGQPEQEE